jgi:sugar/nucleoside kinase (ribokinase family)
MIGADKSGDLIRDTMERNGIHFLFDIDPKGTEEHVNIIDDNGGRISIFTQYATFVPELAYERFEKDIIECDYIVLNIINYVRKLIPVVKKCGKEIWCDIHDYDGSSTYHNDFIEAADYLFMSSDQMKDYRSFMKEQIQKGKKLVVCTHGKYGASALAENGDFVEMPIIDAFERVDVNGAGDNFFSGFLYAYSMGYDLIKSLAFGSIAAGLCISSKEIVNPILCSEYAEQLFMKYFSR